MGVEEDDPKVHGFTIINEDSLFFFLPFRKSFMYMVSLVKIIGDWKNYKSMNGIVELV